jgi:DNA topoisomerase-2
MGKKRDAAEEDGPTDVAGRKFMKIDDLEHINLRSDMYVDGVVPRPQRTWLATIMEPDKPEGSITAADKKRLEKLLEAEKSGADGKAADKVLAKYGTDRAGLDALLAQEGVKSASAPAVTVERREVTYVPALLKIFDEVLTNATDQSKLDESLRTIKVGVKDGLITVRNDGVGLPIGKRMAGSDQELITDLFGSLRSSANYDGAQARIVGGMNGLGVKLANIFSTEFAVTVVDPASGQQFEQRWTDGMKQRGEPRITKSSLKKGFVQVSFRPRPAFLEPHGTLEGDLTALFAKRTLDACACTPPNVAVYWNDIQLPLKKFEHFVETYVGKDTFKVFCHTDNWKVGVAFAEGSDQVSFCNGIATLDGGTHVEHVQNTITSALSRKAAATRGSKELSETHIRNHMWLFVEANIENPNFNSQAKLRLTTPVSKFAPKKWTPDKEALESFVNKIYGSDIVKSARVLADAAEVAKLARVGGKKTATLKQMPKGLEDAHRAGTKDAGQCSLILTEGESAKGFAMAGLKVIGRDYFGVYPLKGKPLNVKDCDVKKQLANKELTDIFQILGLTPGKKYKDSSELRYGSVLVLSDQDHDGAHIRGLVLNLIHEHAKTEAGSTLLHDGYVRTLRTPLLKAFKGAQIRIFYDYHSAESFTRGEGVSGWTFKFFKGLGSSTPEEARECFEEMRENLLRYVGDASTNDKMTLAFGAKREDDRKEWIEARIREVAANPEGVRAAVKTKTKAAAKAKGGPSKPPPPPGPAESVLVNRFIDTELADFSVADVMRTLPQLMDGLKTTQRKVMYVCLKDRLVGERKRQKVFILSSSVAAKTNYHHGNVSMENTIVRLAQNFVGANNVPLLFPDGQYGSRLQGGKDSAASRYIFTFVPEPVTRIFHPEDAHILSLQMEDGDEVEPDTLFPVVPPLLINGSKGIATGFSTTVLPHRTRDVIDAIRAIMDGRPVAELTPYWAGFKGSVEKAGTAWITKGVWRVTGDSVEISELPVGRWTEDYCEMLKDMKAKGTIRDFKNNSFDDSATFTVRFPAEDALNALVEKGDLEKELKLTNRFSAANMHVRVGPRGINKYADTEQLLRAWYAMRLEAYGRRKESMLRRMQDRMAALSAKAKFIETKIREPARFDGKRKAEFEAECERAAVPRLEGGYEFALNVTQRECTLEKVEAMRAELRSLGSEIKQLETTSLETLWRADLDEVEKALC